ncbi:biphenyl-2,3-diol 1,2-dioxygenase [Burkholderia vietnamiensis]|uniref:biphenyl-2,3-diol 1,2-dioxygenase n=1 Tax=Burkholderia vietnamiensis TaxID=60552 RepID=UPI00265625FE|nr:biphenyl-2,3-diol 1,2-dioxygenase [Burkholderia vietnamiensis]MDN8071390.1 biphenyl-2,3-diol 1,2-dioxygenase [Burkholderia vietnamiensis]
MSINRLGYIGFEVTDVPAWRTFATNKLGAMEAAASPTEASFRIDSRAWRFSVTKGSKDDYLFAGYEVDSKSELQAVQENLEALGIAVRVEGPELRAKRGVLGLISTADPFGNRIEVYYGATELFERPFASSTGVTGFQTGDQGIGHYVLNVEDVDAALSFYTGALGFQLADVIDWTVADGVTLTVYFLYCNGRHHTFAFGKLPGAKKLHHFMLQTDSIDDVGLAYDKFDDDGSVVMTLGRHTNDHMVSFYGATPSGFAVEYGWGAREVSSDWSVVRYDRISIWGHKFREKA